MTCGNRSGEAGTLPLNSGKPIDHGGKKTERAWGARVPKRGQAAQETTPLQVKLPTQSRQKCTQLKAEPGTRSIFQKAAREKQVQLLFHFKNPPGVLRKGMSQNRRTHFVKQGV